MFVKDTAKRQEHQVMERRLATHERHQKWVLAQLASAALLEGEIDPTNPERQLGRPMTSEKLIQQLRIYNPKLLIETHPTRSNIIVVSYLRQSVKITAATFEAGVLPEYSIMMGREEVLERPLPVTPEGIETISTQWVPEQTRRRVQIALEEIFNNPTTVYDEDSACALLDQVLHDNPTGVEQVQGRLKRFGRELTRGWRTVLVRLVQQGQLTVNQVERLVRCHGGLDRLSYAVKIGKRQEECVI